ncbi:CopD family protein [Pelagicoccus sp. SDUM812003]|uniref:CopD family protein n=1 Tax=Pelagicoccus sp. SDUM812003 TaxID=3041267 RepID=UPI00280F64D9|nr:CopD family protein [Pelagicoccus sp. SDUM812003]MDQ8204891.1 CopD family protein [Pelagicoccus sp. SDUM812003]
MNTYGTVVVLHLLGACVWVGWHLALAFSLLPQALRVQDNFLWHRIESVYRTVGIPALVVQTMTGFLLAYGHLPRVGSWFDFDNPMGRLIGMKILLLALTFGLGIDLRFRLLPRIETTGLGILRWHVALITVLSVLLAFVGASFRIGWLY